MKNSPEQKTKKLALALVVVNYVSSGKTAMARQLLQPRLDDAPIIPIETINKDEGQDNALKADDFRKAMQAVDIMQAEDRSIIIDVGVSNVELFLAKMKTEKAFGDFDYFIVPVNPDKKTMTNSIMLIEDLSNLHKVPASKILVVFNKTEENKSLDEQFGPIINYHSSMKKFTLIRKAVVHASDVFDLIGVGSLIDAANDKTDYRAAMRAATTIEEKEAVSNNRALHKMAGDAVLELDGVFDALFVK